MIPTMFLLGWLLAFAVVAAGRRHRGVVLTGVCSFAALGWGLVVVGDTASGDRSAALLAGASALALANTAGGAIVGGAAGLLVARGARSAVPRSPL